MTFAVGESVEYIAKPVFDLIIRTGDEGVVTRVEGDWIFATWPRSGEHSVPLGNVRAASAELPEPWWRPDDSTRQSLEFELQAELAPGHPFFRLPLDVRSRCGGCDEVLVSVVDGSFALVHLTWSGRPEEPPWPRVGQRGPYVEATQAMESHATTH